MYRIMLGFLRYDNRDCSSTHYRQFNDYTYGTPELAHALADDEIPF